MKNNNRNIVVQGTVAIIILLLIILGAHYTNKKLQQENLDKKAQELLNMESPEAVSTRNNSLSSTENWKTYTDDLMGFKFKYYPDLSVNKDELDNSSGTLYTFNIDNIELSYPSYKTDDVIDMSILVVKNKTLENFIQEIKDSGAKILKQEAYTLGGIPATKLTLQGEIVGTDIETNYIFAKKNELSFIIQFKEKKETKINPKMIIDTFEFTK